MSLKSLWELQEIDLLIKELEEEIENSPLHREAGEAAERLQSLDNALQEAEKSLKEQRKRLKRGELDLESITAEHNELDRRLYSGEVKSVKELEQMEIKLRSVRKGQLSLEEDLLGLMESIEDEEQLSRNLTVQQGEAAAGLQQRKQSLDEELARLGGELKKMQVQRENLTAQVEPRYLERYRELAQRFQGQGVARVINDICQGCSVFISSAQRGFLYDPQAVVYCENCGRLLVRFTEEQAAAARKEGE